MSLRITRKGQLLSTILKWALALLPLLLAIIIIVKGQSNLWLRQRLVSLEFKGCNSYLFILIKACPWLLSSHSFFFPLMVSFSHREVIILARVLFFSSRSYLGLCLTGMVSELLLVSKEDRDPLGKARRVIRYQGWPSTRRSHYFDSFYAIMNETFSIPMQLILLELT